MSVTSRYFRLAKEVSLRGDSKDARRHYRLGAVGVRRDGAIVTASNVANRTPEPCAHAEARLTRKLDYNSVVYLARTLRNGHVAMARPCRDCQQALRRRGVRTVYYTISDNEYGVLTL